MSEVHRLVYLQYYFDGKENPVKVTLPHGNPKSNNAAPFQPTRSSTKARIKETSKAEAPRKVFCAVLEGAGGYEKVRCFGDHARNRAQITDLRRKTCPDEMIEVLDMCKDQQGTDDAFVRDVTLAPEKTIFLGNNRQLKDIEKFCTGPGNLCVLGADPTYNIGNFYVTLTTYRHLMLTNAKGVSPVMIGPALIHYQKAFDSYFQLPANMLRYHKALSGLKCIGTDGEVNVYEALKSVFHDANHLLCDIHVRDNIETKLTDLGIKGEVRYVLCLYKYFKTNQLLTFSNLLLKK